MRSAFSVGAIHRHAEATRYRLAPHPATGDLDCYDHESRMAWESLSDNFESTRNVVKTQRAIEKIAGIRRSSIVII